MLNTTLICFGELARARHCAQLAFWTFCFALMPRSSRQLSCNNGDPP